MKTNLKLWQLLAGLAVGGGILLFGAYYLFFPHQSGVFSRWGGGAVSLPVPEDCTRVIGFGRGDGKKYVSYVNSKGEIMMHEYTDRGYLEATYKLEGATFDANTLERR